MQKTTSTKQKIRVIIFATLLISIISLSGFAVYAMQSVSIPLEIKDPLEIIDYPTSLSLYTGETTNFEFTVENHALVTIFQEFDFTLNNTDYQSMYVTFSNHNYSISPGTNKLQAWLTISTNAPQANFVITITKKTDIPTPAPTPTQNDFTDSILNPTLELLAGGARWVAQNGNNALYINWEGNYKNHNTTDGSEWEWKSESAQYRWRRSITAALESSNLEITFAGDIPEDLNPYDVVVIFAYYAVEPHHAQQIKDYIQDGGSVVFIAGVPGYFISYSKTSSCSTNLKYIEEWFGASAYLNAHGLTRVAFDNPFGTSLLTDEIVYDVNLKNGAVTSLIGSVRPIAYYDSGEVFAFTHEYGAGRVYYQAHLKLLD